MDLVTEEKGTEREKTRAERRRDELYAKQGRQNRFNNQNQRDEWLKSEIEKVQQQVKRCNDDFKREQEDIREIRRQNQTRNDQINQCRQDMQQYKSEWDRQNERALQVIIIFLLIKYVLFAHKRRIHQIRPNNGILSEFYDKSRNKFLDL